MSFSYTTEAIVLTKRRYTEKAHIYTVYTRDFGKLELLCRGSRKITTKLANHLEPLSHVDICFVRGRKHIQLIGVQKKLTGADILYDYTKLIYACFCIELVDNITKAEHKDQHVFELLLHTIKKIHISNTGYDSLIFMFGFLLVCSLGFQPELHMCVLCECVYSQERRWAFTINGGGIVCDQCLRKSDYLHDPISHKEAEALQSYAGSLYNGFVFHTIISEKLKNIMKEYILYYTETRIRSHALLIHQDEASLSII
jgi:DNA repair protein RecO (recombination protein O)